jgi:AraC family transcriptional regulator, ethanolamine operon transcriptional activator
MEIEEPPGDIVEPSVTVVDICDPTTVNAGIELIDQDAVQLQSKPLRARRVITRLETATVMFHSCNLRLRTATSVRKDFFAYVTFGPQAKGTVNGLAVRPGLMLAVAPETEVRFVVDAGWEAIAFLLPPHDINVHLNAR